MLRLPAGADSGDTRMQKPLAVAVIAAVVLHGFLLLAVGYKLPAKSDSDSSSPANLVQLWSFTTTKALAEAEPGPSVVPFSQAPKLNTAQNANTTDKKGSPSLPALFTLHRDAWTQDLYLETNDVDMPAAPTIDWMLPLKKGYLDSLRRMVVRVWIREDGVVSGAEIISIEPPSLNENQMRETLEWLLETPMQAAKKNGQTVASTRTVEMAFESP
jgi:hypothetical protein